MFDLPMKDYSEDSLVSDRLWFPSCGALSGNQQVEMLVG